MSLTHRCLRYVLALAAAAAVILFPAACDMAAVVSAPPGSGSLGSNVDDQPGDDGPSSDDPSNPGDDVTVDAPPDVPGDSTDDSNDGANDPADDGEGDPTDAGSDSGGGDDVPADGGNDDDNDAGNDGPGDDADDDDSSSDDGDNSNDDDAGDDDPPSSSDVPDNEYCADVADWSGTWVDFEEEVLELVNQHRAAGADCGTQGDFDPADPLTMHPALRCAARAHSMDMNLRDFFSHTNPDGDGPGQRLSYAGYSGFGWGENIAWGYGSPASVVAGWMGSDGHCANIMRPQFTSIGVGYYEGNYWTQTFGAD